MKRSLTISKSEGASRQIEEALKALHRGDFDIAVTLAGAAEGMIERSGMHLWAYILNHPRAAEFEKPELIAGLNAARDWLKHPTRTARDTLTLTRADAVHMIMRAMSKLEAWSRQMWQFDDWLKQNVDDL
jgi:hypothetical protein